jgi:hypothetical protein
MMATFGGAIVIRRAAGDIDAGRGSNENGVSFYRWSRAARSDRPCPALFGNRYVGDARPQHEAGPMTER